MLDRINVRSWIGPHCEIQVNYLDSSQGLEKLVPGQHCWNKELDIHPLFHAKSWQAFPQPRYEKAPAVFSGGLKEDATGLHSFIAMRRHSRSLMIICLPCQISATCLCYTYVSNFFYCNMFSLLLAGLPSNINIVSSGRGAQRLREDISDVVILTKRFASDKFLIQDFSVDRDR